MIQSAAAGLRRIASVTGTKFWTVPRTVTPVGLVSGFDVVVPRCRRGANDKAAPTQRARSKVETRRRIEEFMFRPLCPSYGFA
jgi:hypothetical protein